MGEHRLGHAGLTVSDMDASLVFWRDVLGFEETGRGLVEWEHLDRLIAIEGTKIEWVELRLPDGMTVELQQHHPPGPALPQGDENEPGRSHLGLVVDDLEATLRRAQDLGFRSRSEDPVEIPRGTFEGWSAVYILDPDGYGIELMQPGSDSSP
jgi:catechol 2,3-dioxygenase-like lactoylglutathione lyase family enzyme